MQSIRFETMSDDRVLECVESLMGRSNAITAELLAYLAEVEERQLHLRAACPSMFVFCVERLHMSESSAGKRIWAARTARRFPLVLEMIERGEIHVTAVNILAPHLTEENHAELLARARHRSKRETERLVAEIAPRPDVASRVVTLPRRPIQEVPVSRVKRVASAVAPGAHGDERGGVAPSHASGGRRAVVAPLSPRRYEIRVTVDQETHDKLRELQDLLSHQIPGRDPAVIIARAIDSFHTQTLARKAAITHRPRASKPPAVRSRHIPASVRRTVWKRDGGRCAFVDVRGQRCSATAFVEFHHIHNWARGANHSPAEIELRCRTHNLYQAELDYGADFVAACRSAEAPRMPAATSPAREGRAHYRAATSSARALSGARAPPGVDACAPRCDEWRVFQRERGVTARMLAAGCSAADEVSLSSSRSS